jgi:hypothetical protein
VSLAEEFAAIVEGLRSYTIHGDPYVILYFSHISDPDTIHHAQLSADALPAGLRVGDPIWVYRMLGVVAGVTRRDATQPPPTS